MPFITYAVYFKDSLKRAKSKLFSPSLIHLDIPHVRPDFGKPPTGDKGDKGFLK